jgi:uncharacterized protein (TIGR00725 family)
MGVTGASQARKLRIGVIGSGQCDEATAERAFQVGMAIGRSGAILLCGGLGGVMHAAARGAKAAGGLTVGILPGGSAEQANPCIDIPIVTAMGQARNVILVQSCQALVAVAGGFGTLSEIALAFKLGVPCVGIGTWSVVPELYMTNDPSCAVAKAIEMAGQRACV